MTVDVEALRAAIVQKEPPFSLNKIGHVVLLVADLKRSLEFYTGVLGFKVSDIYGEDIKESTQLFSALANYEVAWAFSSAALLAGRVKLLATGTRARLAAYPDVPTVAESGGPADFSLDAWTALIAPAGTPPAIVAQINKSVVAALGEADLRQRFTTFAYESFTLSPADSAKLIEAETHRYADIIRNANISFD